MKITILNGNDQPANGKLETYLDQLVQALQAGQHQVTRLDLREMDIRFCTGCFGCWMKTPGECVTVDDSASVCRAVINSDFTLFAAPMIMGYPGALLKKTMDRLIPLIHPYFSIVNGEAHHRARYNLYPLLGLLVEPGSDTDADDMRLTGDMVSRTALNFKSHLSFVSQTDQSVAELVKAITSKPSAYIPFVQTLKPTMGVSIKPVMRLTVFNGSPRGTTGNTPIFLEQFLKGFKSLPGRESEMFQLNRVKDVDEFTQAFAKAEAVLLGFPLYTDSMPGVVKVFIDALEPFVGRQGNPPIGFLVQSGFPESQHSRHVERYLEKLAERLGSPYLGTIVKGGGEGVHVMPDSMNSKLFTALQQIGTTFAENGKFDPALLSALARPERYPAFTVFLYRLLQILPIVNFYWNGQLKQNKVFDRRFARPYQE